VQRVAAIVDRRPVFFPMPIWFHYLLAWCVERIMSVPLVSIAQVRILTEGLAEPSLPCERLSAEFAPALSFNEDQIRKGLPAAGAFTWRDLRCCRGHRAAEPVHRHAVFFELP
jgi:hypothetical protein